MPLSGGHIGVVGRAMAGTSLVGGVNILAGFLSGNEPLTHRGRVLTATVIMVEPVCRTCEVPRNCGCVVRAFFPTEVFGAGIYSSIIFCGSMVLTNAVVLQ